jgi:protein-S-isoprenylcysteine O-methyltransferase Ste14
LIGFTSLILLNVFVLRTVPLNPLEITQPWVAVGQSLLVLGLAIRSWSAGTLMKSRELTTVGPYAVVRNPLYFGSFLMMFGFCILCRDWATLAFVAGPLLILYWVQVQIEEKRMAEMFPAQWPNYFATVPRFLPRLYARQAFTGWSASGWLGNREYQAMGASIVGLVAVYVWHILVS